MAYKINNKEIISDNREITLTGATSFTNFIEIASPSGPNMVGTRAGFITGGKTSPSPSVTTSNNIEKFSFVTTSVKVVEVGSLANDMYFSTGNQSDAAGFHSGGTANPGGLDYTDIQKYPFSILDGTAVNAGDLSSKKILGAGTSSDEYAFYSAGYVFISSPGVLFSAIERFPFAITGVTTDVGDLLQSKEGGSSNASDENSFYAGGWSILASPTVYFTDIEKFPFAITSGTSTDVGDLNYSKTRLASHNTPSHGFTSGGFNTTIPDANENTIDKFPFAISSGTATDVGDMLVNRTDVAGNSSPSFGYIVGGLQTVTPSPYASNVEKFPFAISSGTATAAGFMLEAKFGSTATQD